MYIALEDTLMKISINADFFFLILIPRTMTILMFLTWSRNKDNGSSIIDIKE